MDKVSNLRKEANKLSLEADAVFKRWEAEEMPEAELKHMQNLIEQANGLLNQAETIEKHLEMKASLEKSVNKAPVVTTVEEELDVKKMLGESFDHEATFGSFCRKGYRGVETKALNRIESDNGGVLVPDQFVARVIEKMYDINKLRNLVDVLQVGEASVVMPTYNQTPSPAYVAENGAIGEETMDGIFGEQRFTPKAKARMFRLSKLLLRDAKIDVAGLIQNRFAQRFAELEEDDILNGDGVNEPLGLLNATFSTTAQTITAANMASATAVISALAGMVYGIEEQNRRGAVFLASRGTMQLLMSLVDGNNQPIVQPSMQAGQPPMLRGYPLIEVEAFADVASDGDAYLIFGNLKRYLLVERAGLVMERTEEGESAFSQHQVLFKMLREYDGNILDSNAFIRLNRTS